jgi:hypothetical protein
MILISIRGNPWIISPQLLENLKTVILFRPYKWLDATIGK